MKSTIVSLLVIALIFAGCKQQENKQEAVEVNPEKPVVYASNYPLYYFANRIAEGTIDLRLAAGDLSDPSIWQPVADTIARMQAADLILVNGASFEGWLMNVSLPDEKVVNTSQGFSDALLSSGSTVTHSHGDEGEHEHEGTAFTTWLDLGLAAKQAAAVTEALGRLQPENKTRYDENYHALAADLTALDREYQQTVAAGPARVLAFSHPVYQYLEKAYGIEGKSLHWEPGTPLDHDMLHEIEHLKDDFEINFLVWEGTPLPENVEKLNQMGIKSVVISPMGGMTGDQDFMEGIRKNLEVLKEVYGE